MKIAVFHNFLDNIGGAEIVVLTLARELGADVYTTNIAADKISAMGFEDLLPRIHSIGHVPLNAPFRQQISFYRFRKLNLGNRYDLYIIAGDWAMSGGVLNKPNLWYVHSPLNELWEFSSHIRGELLPFWKRGLYDLWVRINRRLTLKYGNHINKFVCNSENTRSRLKKYYGKEAEVINPPIDTKNFRSGKSKNYWLSVNRIVRHKRIEIQTEAFKKLPEENLIIVGSYEKDSKHFEEYRSEIENLKPSNVKIMSWVCTQELRDLYANCKGVITTSMNEDFGMTAVEAMASGKPVIAPNEGGYKESTVNGKTGILIDDINPEKLVAAIKTLSQNLDQNPHMYVEACKNQAKQFDTEIFVRKIKAKINS